MKHDENDVILKVQEYLAAHDFCDDSDEDAYKELTQAFNYASNQGYAFDKLVVFLLRKQWAIIDAGGYKTLENAYKLYIKLMKKEFIKKIKELDDA